MDLGMPFFLLLASIPVVLAVIARMRRSAAAAWDFGDWGAIERAPRTWRERLRLTPSLLRAIAAAALAIAGAAPSILAVREERSPVPRELVIALDASGSMLAMDLDPDRFGAARRFAAELIARRPSDRVGVLAFGGRTSWVCPITHDRQALDEGLRHAQPGTDALGEGTALGPAIVSAIEQLGRGARKTIGAIVVLTDGASNDPRLEPIDAANLAARRGVRIHAIGFGQDGPARYPTEVGVLDVTLPVRDEILRRVTSATGGRYWRVTDRDAFERVLAALDETERPESVRREQLVLVPLQAPLLGFAALVLIIEIALTAGPLRVRSI